MKEGSAFEDCALIEALANVTREASACADEVRHLLRALVLYAFDSQAAELQRKYDDVTSLMRHHKDEIWIAAADMQNDSVSEI